MMHDVEGVRDPALLVFFVFDFWGRFCMRPSRMEEAG
jgi:hypothetical protein